MKRPYKTDNEIKKEASSIVEKINNACTSVINTLNEGPLFPHFVSTRGQPNSFHSIMVLRAGMNIERNEDQSEQVIIERAIGACQRMSDILEHHMDRLEEMLHSTG